MARAVPLSSRPLALITGASSGIGLYLAREAAQAGYDLLLAADTPFDDTRRLVEPTGVKMETVDADLATRAGVDQLCEALRGRVPELLMANAGHGLGKAFLDEDFDEARDVVDTNVALRNELKETGISVTCLMPGPTDTEFFERADLMDTKVGQEKKMDAAEVARIGFRAMMDGEGDVVAGLKNKLQAAIANVTPNAMLAEQHRKMAEPGTNPN